MAKAEHGQVPTWWQQAPFADLRKAYQTKNREPLFFIGSGLSRGAGLPGWASLLRRLEERYRSLYGDSPMLQEARSLIDEQERDPTRKTQCLRSAGSKLKEIYSINGDNSWRSAIDEIISGPERATRVSRVHDVLVKLRWNRIITTNYDSLIEEALVRNQLEAEVYHPWKEIPKEIEHARNRIVFKVHGDTLDSSSQIILTTEEYDQLHRSNSPLWFELTSVMRAASVIIFVGYSHIDDYLKTLVTWVMPGVPREKAFALVPRREGIVHIQEQIASMETELGIRFITYSPDGEHSELLELLEYLGDPETREAHYSSLIHARRPTVVLVYCGGTIGAAMTADSRGPSERLNVVKKHSRYDLDLEGFSSKLLRWYQSSYNAGNAVELDILWEVLPVEHQVLSENATPELWTHIIERIRAFIFKYFVASSLTSNPEQATDPALLSLFEEEEKQFRLTYPGSALGYKRFASDFKNRYILGFVLLFGTDTLAFLSSACALGLHHLPCPIVITGANQPPNEEDVAARSQFYASSDAWKNLMTSLYFLQCFGHRLTESFVCFGETVHHGVNLRKRAIDIMPFGRDSLATRYQEPFTFRNLSIHGQYMFRLIDGIFCNNYYSSSSLNYSELVGHESSVFSNLRHIRWHALQELHPQAVEGEAFCSCVGFMEATPNFAYVDVEKMIATNEAATGLRAILVEGYSSGTYPSAPGNSFSKFLWELYQNGIPVVLVSRFGIMATQHEYEVSTIEGVKIPVLPLFGIITETALPLLSLVVGSICEEKWCRNGANGPQHVQWRIELIRRELDSFFAKRPNIISEELRNINNRGKLFAKMMLGAIRASEDGSHSSSHQSELSLRIGGNHDSMTALGVEEIALPRGAFLPLIREITASFERVGSGPDGFAALSNLGFRFGLPLVNDLDRGCGGGEGFDLFYDRPREERAELESQARSLLASAAVRLKSTGIADVETGEFSVFDDSESASEPGALRRFSFSVIVRRREELEWRGEKYAVMSFSEMEAEFFSLLSHGCGGGPDAVRDHQQRLQRIYGQLLRRRTWQTSMSRVDWFLVGMFKGVACGLAEFLRFDLLAVNAVRIKDPGQLRTLRQAVKVRTLFGDENGFKASFSYSENQPNSE